MSYPSAAVHLVLATVLCTLIILAFLDDSVVRLIPPDYDSILRTDSTPFTRQNGSSSEILFDFCKLPELDPWDPSIVGFLKPNQNAWKGCKPAIKFLSNLTFEGELVIDANGTAGPCFYRCLKPVSDYSMSVKKWHQYKPGATPRCDVVEVKCTNSLKNGLPTVHAKSLYHYLHAQIYRDDRPSEPLSSFELSSTARAAESVTKEKPDVHIILFDSVSESQFLRSMPMTRHVLAERYDAVNFQHLNKIGLNSRPNGFALLFGKAIADIKKSSVSRGHKADYNYKGYCEKPLDNDQFIGFRFQDDGYTTMMSEDWSLGVFNWPNCKGFNSTPTDHYMRPFQLRLEGDKYKAADLNWNLQTHSCRETYYYQMEYLKQFVDKYPDRPKFSLTWMTYLAHDDNNALYHTDAYFAQFFKDYRHKFNNSYLFVMGDHGARFGDIRKTDLGEMEDNNPFLFLSVPENVKSDNVQLVEQLRSNSKKLITHYDLYATFLDIVQPATPRIQNPLIKGSSIFKPLPNTRTCDQLMIPFDFCSCQKDKSRMPDDNNIGTPAAALMVESINNALQGEEDTKDVCAELKLSKKAKILTDKFVTKSRTSMYRVEITTVPGNGNFWAYIIESPNGTLEMMSERCPRLNAYAHQVNCAYYSKFASYCFCKNLMKKQAETAANTSQTIEQPSRNSSETVITHVKTDNTLAAMLTTLSPSNTPEAITTKPSFSAQTT